MAAEQLEAGEMGGEVNALEAGVRRDGEVELEAWGHEKTELEARVMRVRGRKAWKAKIKREKEQELEEIRCLGKVRRDSAMRLLARHMLHKAATGPFGKPSLRRRQSQQDFRSGVTNGPPGKPGPTRRLSQSLQDFKSSCRVTSGGRVKVDRGEEWVVGQTGSRLGQESQREELDTLRSMKLVQSHLANREMLKRAMRMFNQRIYVKPTNVPSHKGNSILVTEYKESSAPKKLFRQQSRMVIDNFFNIPSRNRRVLDKLNLEQVKKISDTELHKSKSKRKAALQENSRDVDDHTAASEEGKRKDWREGVQRVKFAKKMLRRQPTELEDKGEEVEWDHKPKVGCKVRLPSDNVSASQTSTARVHDQERKLGFSKSNSAHSFLNGGEEMEKVEQPEMEGRLRAGHKLKWRRKEPKQSGHRRHHEKKGMLNRNKAMSRKGDFLAPQEDILPADVLPQGKRSSSAPSDSLLFTTAYDREGILPLPSEESTDGSEMVPAGELQALTTVPLPQGNNVAVCTTSVERVEHINKVSQYDRTMTLSSVPPPPAKFASGSPPSPPPPPPPPPPNEFSFGSLASPPPPLTPTSPLPPTNIASASPVSPPPLLTLSPPPTQLPPIGSTAVYMEATACKYYDLSDEKDRIANSDVIPNSSPTFLYQHSLEPQLQLSSETTLSFVESLEGEAPVSQRNLSTTETSTDEEETSPKTSCVQPQSHKLSVNSATSSTSTVPDHFSPESVIGIVDVEDNAFEATSPTGTGMLFEISSSKSSSFDSNPSTGSSIPKYKRFFSSPQISFISDESDSQLAASLHALHTGTPHGYYLETNPFNVEFQEALRGNTRQDSGGTTDEESTQGNTPDKLPSRLLEDSNFRDYVSRLNRKPKKSDYISYKIAIIGDEIDKKYDQQLNQALDAIIYEVMKKNVSWKSFNRVSQKLMVQGQHMTDGIFMIPCFARRLLECVPNMRDTIASYTELVMDSYAADLILDVGGWAPLMAQYTQTEANADYDDWDDVMTQLHQEGAVDTFGPMGYDLFTPDPKYAKVSLATTCGLHHPTAQTAHTLPRISDTPGSRHPVSLDNPTYHKANYQNFEDHLLLHPFANDPDNLHLPSGGQIRKSRSIEVLVCGEEMSDIPVHDEEVYPPKLLRLTSRRHSFSRGLSTLPTETSPPVFVARGSSPIPIRKPQRKPGSEYEGTNGTPTNVISVGQPVYEHMGMVEVGTTETQTGSYFIFHSRSSSLESSSTIRIVTGEEELSQPEESPSLPARFKRQHGHSRSSSLTNPAIHPGGSTSREGRDPHAHHRTGSLSSDEIWDMDLDSPVGKTPPSSKNNSNHGDCGAQPPRRGRRLSEAISGNIARVGPVLTHTIGALVYAFVYARQK